MGGVAANAVFSLTNSTVVAVPASISSTAGTPQTATVSTAFGSVLAATVRDAAGNALSGISVTFSLPATGASGSFAGGAVSAVATTDGSGVARSPVLTANASVGAWSAQASVAGLASGTSFSLTNVAAPGVPSALVVSSGNAQSAPVGTAFGSALAVTVRDASGNALSGVSVSFSLPATGVSGTFAGGTLTAVATTNSSGIATSPIVTANSSAGSWTATASVAGVATVASFTLTNTVVVGPPASITVSGGDGQSTAINTVFGQVLAATVKDSLGNPVPNVFVLFNLPATGASGAFQGGLTFASAATNSLGVAQSPMITANGTSGQWPATASVTGVVTVAAYSLTNTNAGGGSGGSGNLRLVSQSGGGGQTALIGTAFASPLRASVFNPTTSAPVAGVAVTFTLPSFGASGSFPGGALTATVNTDASGIAQAPTITANTRATAWLATASIAGGQQSLFGLENLPGAPASMLRNSTFSQDVKVGAVVADPFSVGVFDAYFNRIEAVTVTFTAPSTGATGTFAGGGASAVVFTDAGGAATAPAFTAGNTPGTYTVRASIAGGASVDFSVTNTP